MNKFLGNNRYKSIIELNIASIFVSTSGVLGRYIDLPVPTIIATRSILAGILIFLFCKWKKFDFNIKKEDRLAFLAGGLLMGLHWLTYFYTLKLSSVAVGMLLIFTYPIITAFLEPLILKTKFQKMHLLLACIVLVGIYFLVPGFVIKEYHVKVFGMGVFSAFCFSLRNIIMKSKSTAYNGSILMFYQLVIVTICLFPFLFILDNTGFVKQLPANLLLALLTTAIGHTYYLYSFRKLSTTSVGIISSIQPMYGIILGMIFLNEYPETGTMIGGGLILISVIIESIRSYNRKVNVAKF